MSKKITEQQIKATAKKNGIEYAVLRSILEVECKGSGFLPNGTPTILFERHKFWEELGKIGFITIRKRIRDLRPDLCHAKPTKRGGYGSGSEQPQRMGDAINLVFEVLPDHLTDYEVADAYNKVRDCGLKAASWGLGQIMGFNYSQCGFNKLQDFINAMYDSEQAQLDVVVQLLKSWGLLDAMRRKDWRAIAKAWNGSKYWVYSYHKKLAKNYLRYA